MEEVRRLGALKDSAINEAKEVLAFETTKLVHGEEEAQKALEAARAIFSSKGVSVNAPTTFVEKDELDNGIKVFDILKMTNLVPSNAEARRLIEQGGLTINDEKITDKDFIVSSSLLKDEVIMIKKGKKTFHQIKVK